MVYNRHRSIAIGLLCGAALLLLCAGGVLAADPAVTITVSKWAQVPLEPTNFTITELSATSINITWTMGVAANSTIIRGGTTGYPWTVLDGTPVYSGNATYVVVNDLDLAGTCYYIRAWSENEYGTSTTYTQASAGYCGGGIINMSELVPPVILSFLALIALGLTIAMFATKNFMLGFPSGIFWAIIGGYAYQQSASTGDWQYLLFFASMGMVIFAILAAFTLRRRDLAGPDEADDMKYIDEGGGGPKRPGPSPRRSPSVAARAPQPDRGGSWGDIDSLGMHDLEDRRTAPSMRSSGVRDRAARRRSGIIVKSTGYGEFK